MAPKPPARAPIRPTRAVPEPLGGPPARLNETARAVWSVCVAVWGDRLGAAHSEALALYCIAAARLEAYEAKIAEDGEMVKANNGFPVMHPMRAAAAQLERELHKQAMAFAALPVRRDGSPGSRI